MYYPVLALEALMHKYPKGQYRALLIAPHLAGYYKWGNRIRCVDYDDIVCFYCVCVALVTI